MKAIDIVSNIFLLLGGIGLFLYGLKVMSDSLETFAGGKLRRLFEKLTDNKVKGVLVGAGTTAVIQSSSATTVIVVGFVNAGIFTLKQAVPIIMGANIGTTVTALIMALPISELLTVLSFIGIIIMMATKNDTLNKIGTICVGLAMIFIGLNIMSNAMYPFRDKLAYFFQITKNPLLLVIIGMLFTAIIQSSSAATGIMLALVGASSSSEQILTLYSAIFVILGVNMGTCITAIIASIGTSANAKRTAFVHFLFNFVGAIIFFILMIIKPIGNFIIERIEVVEDVKMQIAIFHIIFNVISTIIMLPASDLLVKASNILVKDSKNTESENKEIKLKYLNDLILSSPAIAVAQIKKEIMQMADIAKVNFDMSIEAITTNDLSKLNQFNHNEKYINFLNRRITEYLVKISSLEISFHDEKKLGSFYHVVSDFERIGDYSENIMDYTEKMNRESIEFSDDAKKEILDMYNKITILYDKVIEAFSHADLSLLGIINEIENSVDKCKKDLSAAHIKRLNDNTCSADSGAIFLSLVSNMERIADHMTNVSTSLKDYAKATTKVVVTTKNI